MVPLLACVVVYLLAGRHGHVPDMIDSDIHLGPAFHLGGLLSNLLVLS